MLWKSNTADTEVLNYVHFPQNCTLVLHVAFNSNKNLRYMCTCKYVELYTLHASIWTISFFFFDNGC